MGQLKGTLSMPLATYIINCVYQDEVEHNFRSDLMSLVHLYPHYTFLAAITDSRAFNPLLHNRKFQRP